MNQKIEISVIICSYNRALYITAALESLDAQTLGKEKFEVLVVDNNSTDDTGAVILSFKEEHPALQLKYSTETIQGASFARNSGANKACGYLLCFMDDDAIAHPFFLEKIIDFFTAHPNASALGGKIIPKYIPSKPEWMSYFVSSMVGNFHYSKEMTIFKKGTYPLESNMTVKRDDFETIGGFNTNLPGVKGTFRVGGEGKDFFFRLQNLGKIIYYDPSIMVYHVVEVNKLTPEYLYRIASGYGRGEKIRTLSINTRAYRKKQLEYGFKLLGSVAIGAYYALTGRPSKTWPVIRFRIDALKGLLE
ncbi:MAG: glycosyltransferase family 2 protein [Flavisolibacter sp.]